MTPELANVKALVFDVFGTVVDWRSSIIADLTAFGHARGLKADWAAFTDAWRELYQPSMEEVRSGRRPWTILDVLHRESLDTLIARYGLTGLTEADRQHMNRAWHRLHPWPDSVPGLTRLKRKYIISTLSNGNVALLTNMAKFAGLPWDCILSAELFRHYKREPQVYMGACDMLCLERGEVMMVAAHKDDLLAARQHRVRRRRRPRRAGSGARRPERQDAEDDGTADSMLHAAGP